MDTTLWFKRPTGFIVVGGADTVTDADGVVGVEGTIIDTVIGDPAGLAFAIGIGTVATITTS